MNYTSFCESLLASLTNHLSPDMIITKETIRKNNNVPLDAFLIRRPDEMGAPVVYLQPLYENYEAGLSLETIVTMVVDRVNQELPISLELVEELQLLENARDKIAFRLVSRDENQELLADVPWIPYLDLAIIFYVYLGVKDGQQISSVILNRQAKKWKLPAEKLLTIAKENTPRLFPEVLGRMEHILFGCEEDDPLLQVCDSMVPPLYILTNSAGLSGASCLLYDDVIKNFADKLESDLIILPSSIHEVLIVPDSHREPYEKFLNMVHSVNSEHVPPEEILSNRIYLYHRGEATISLWDSSCSDTPSPHASESL